MLPLVSLTVALSSSYTVRAVEQTSAFAGKMGTRVETRLLVEREGASQWIRLSRRHTIAGRIPTYSVGDTVQLPIR